MEDYLYQKNLYLPLSKKTKKQMTMKDIEWDILDRKALGTIWLCLAVLIVFNISKEMTIEGLIKNWPNYMKNPRPQISTIKFDDVVDVILSEEMQWKISSETSGNALTTETRGGKMERGKSPRYRSKSRKGRSKSRAGIVCWKCGKKGHLKKDCKSQKGKEGDA
eukprot:PITA_23230